MINGDHKRGFFKRSWNKKRDFFFFGSIVAEMWGNICNFQDIKNKKNTWKIICYYMRAELRLCKQLICNQTNRSLEAD